MRCALALAWVAAFSGCGRSEAREIVVGDGTPDFFPNTIYLREKGRTPVSWPSLHFDASFGSAKPAIISKIDLRFSEPFDGAELRVGEETVRLKGARGALEKQDWANLSARAGLTAETAGVPLRVRIALSGQPDKELEVRLAVQPAYWTQLLAEHPTAPIPVNPDARGWLVAELASPPYDAHRASKGDNPKPLSYRISTSPSAHTVGDVRYIARRTDVSFARSRCRSDFVDVRSFTSKVVVVDRKDGRVVAERASRSTPTTPCGKEAPCVGPGCARVVPNVRDYRDDPFDDAADRAWIDAELKKLGGG